MPTSSSRPKLRVVTTARRPLNPDAQLRALIKRRRWLQQQLAANTAALKPHVARVQDDHGWIVRPSVDRMVDMIDRPEGLAK